MSNENGAIWQCQNGVSGTEAAVLANDANDVLLFNDSEKVIGGGLVLYISDIEVDFRRAVPENESVDADNNEIQDMGVDGLDITIQAVSGNADYDNVVNPVNKLSKWLQDGNTVTGFTKGRYGLRFDNAPQWNVVPTTTYGYVIRDINIKYIGEKKDQAMITIRLALGGDLTTAI